MRKTKQNANDRLGTLPLGYRSGFWLVLFSLLVAGGCGTGEYNRRMELRLKDLTREGRFFELLDSRYIKLTDAKGRDVGIELRMPKFPNATGKAWRVGSRNDRDEKVELDRVKPPFMEVPGFSFSYEIMVRPAAMRQQMVPVYCYFYLIDKNEMSESDLIARARTALKAEFSDYSAAEPWQEEALDAPQQGTVAWKTTTAIGEQTFNCNESNGGIQQLEGRFDLFLHTTEHYHLLVGWRAPDSVTGDLRLFEAARTSLGTLRVDDTAVPPEGEETGTDAAAAATGT